MFKLKIYTFYILLALNLHGSFVEPKRQSLLQQGWNENFGYNENSKKLEGIEEENLDSIDDFKQLIPIGFKAISTILEAQKAIKHDLEVGLEMEKVQQTAIQDIQTRLSKLESQQAHIDKTLETGWHMMNKIIQQARYAQMGAQQTNLRGLPALLQSFRDIIL